MKGNLILILSDLFVSYFWALGVDRIFLIRHGRNTMGYYVWGKFLLIGMKFNILWLRLGTKLNNPSFKPSSKYCNMNMGE